MRWSMPASPGTSSGSRRRPVPSSAFSRPTMPPATSPRWPSAFQCASPSIPARTLRSGLPRACPWWSVSISPARTHPTPLRRPAPCAANDLPVWSSVWMSQGLKKTMEMTARTEKKRAQILDGARAVFLVEGFDGASMEAIAHAAGVSKGTLYTYFKGKDELFTSLVAAYQNRSLEETFRSLNKASDPRENLETLARNYLARVHEPENLALLRVVVGASAKFPSLGRDFYETGMNL